MSRAGSERVILFSLSIPYPRLRFARLSVFETILDVIENLRIFPFVTVEHLIPNRIA